MLDDKDEFLAALRRHAGELLRVSKQFDYAGLPPQWIQPGEMHCGVCRAARLMDLRPLMLPSWVRATLFEGSLPAVSAAQIGTTREDRIADQHPGLGLFEVVCRQCSTPYLFLLAPLVGGSQELHVVPGAPGQGGTTNTPEAVAFYLDQAWRAKNAGAYSASLAMYRSALEHLLHDQGYVESRVSDNLKALRREKGAKEASRPWVAEVDDVTLELLKGVADGALHPNEGDVNRQRVIDRELVAAADAAFARLLDLVYERPARDAAAQKSLQTALRGVRGRDREPGA